MALSLLVVFALATGACDGKKPANATETPKTQLEVLGIDVNKAFFVTPEGKSTNDGSSWQKSMDLQKAIDTAAADATKKFVLVAKGSYYADPNKTDITKTFVLKDGVKIYGGFDTSDINKARDYRASILEGELKAKEGTNPAIHTKQILKGENLSENTILDGFLIQNALNADNGNNTDAPKNWIKGALFLNNSSPQLNNLTFNNNKLTGKYAFGGAIFNNSSNPSISNSTFSNNSADGDFGGGGAIYNRGSKPSISNSNFNNNSTNGDYSVGGAIYIYESSLSISNSSFSKNSTNLNGGAIYNWESSLSISNSSFSNNSAKEYGGVIHNYEASLSISNSSFSKNSSNWNGGAIYNEQNSSPKIYNSIFWDNKDKHTGTEVINNIYNFDATADTPIIKNSILNANSAVTKRSGQNSNKVTDPYDFTANDAKFKDNQTPATFSIDAGGKVASTSQVLIKDKGDNVLYKEVTKKEASNDKDLAGKPRLHGSTIDIGAYELQE